MGFLELILSVALYGLLVWALLNFVPMAEPFRRAILILSTIGLVIFIANALGLIGSLPAHLR